MNGIRTVITRLLLSVLALNPVVGMAQVAVYHNATTLQSVCPTMPVMVQPRCTLSTQEHKQAVTVDAKQLVRWAETLELGYKTANLMQLRQLLQRLNGKLPGSYQVQVPQFYGIGAAQTNSVLRTQGLNLAREWAVLVETTVTKEMQATHTVTPDFVKACEGLATKIEEKFNKAADKIAADEKAQQNQSLWSWLGQCVWPSASPLVAAGFDAATVTAIETLVKAVAADKGFVTLRSTGLREDTTKVANAGGNESREIVKATLLDAVRAMGAVAASYLKAKSLGQRSGKDEKIFELPQLPVLLQRVVGEHEGTPVVSCVAYSQERQGNTRGVSATQCNHGHGKSVVDSLFPVDTYYVDDKTGAMVSVIRVKPKRMAPRSGSTTFGLEAVTNDEKQQKEPALDTQAQRAIHHIVMALESAYGQPMDVELVTDPTKKIIYLVQARPIVYEAQKVQPVYVADTVTFDKANAITCKKIYETGTVYRLKPSDLLVADNLEGALTSVLDAESKKQPDPQVIVVKEPGAITSHAGATLAGKGIVLLQADETKPLSDLLAQKDAALLVDTQRGLIANIGQDKRFAGLTDADLAKAGMLVVGRYNHPIPAVVTVDVNVARRDVDQKLAHYLDVKDSMAKQPVQELVTMLKEAPYAQAREALDVLLGRVAKEIDDLSQQKACKDVVAVCHDSSDKDVCKIQTLLKGTCFKEKTAATAAEKMQAVFNAMLGVATHVEQKLAASSRSLERLLMVNFFEALLLQEQSSVVVDAYSVENIKTAFAKEVDFMTKKLAPLVAEKAIDATLFTNRPLLRIAQKGADAVPTEQAEAMWITLVSKLGGTLKSAELKNFMATVDTIDALGALPTWIYARVVPAVAKESDAVKLSEALLKEFAASKPAVAQLQETKQRLATLDYSRWQDSKMFEVNVKNLKEQLLDPLETKEFLSIFAEGSGQALARMLAVPVMRELVEAFNTIILTVQLSKDVQHFKTLVEHFLNLLNAWAHVVPAGVITYHQMWPLDTYLAKLMMIADHVSLKEEQLLPSSGFAVNTAKLGTAVNFLETRNLLPRTLADLFTTVHQSLLVVLGAFAQELVQAIELPSLVRKADGILRKNFSWCDWVYKCLDQTALPVEVAAHVTGTMIDQGSVTVFYNLSLRSHSLSFALSWSRKFTGVELAYVWNAQNECDRWENISEIASLMSDAYDVVIKDKRLSVMGVAFTQLLQHEAQLDAVAKLIQHLLDESNCITTEAPELFNIQYLEDLARRAARKKPKETYRRLLLLRHFHFGERIIEDCYKNEAEPWEFMRETIKDADATVRYETVSEFIRYAAKQKYEAEVFEIVGEVLRNDKVPFVCSRVFKVLGEYAAKKNYEAEVFKVATEAARGVVRKDQDTHLRADAIGLLGRYVIKPEYVDVVCILAEYLAKDQDLYIRAKASELLAKCKYVKAWAKLSWYQKIYWKSRYLLGATDGQFMQAQRVR